MTDQDQPKPQFPAIEEIAHLALSVGRLLLQNGADTAQVQESVTRFALAFGCEVHLLVTYEALLLTAVLDGQFRTKAGSRVPAMNVNMAIVTAVNRLIGDAEMGRRMLPEARVELEAIEHRRPVHSRWVVVIALGLTAASLSRLFGGDWPTFGFVWLAGGAGTWLRQELGRREFNLFFTAAAGAFLSGIIGAVGVKWGWCGTPSLCLVAPGMIIVPGVPLVNGVQDMIKNHMTLGLSRLGLGGLITLAIALGLFLATVLTGVNIPVDAPGHGLSVAEDAFFSALAALGYVFLFNVPVPISWACVVCGTVSHAARTLCLHLGIDLVSGTLIGSALAGLLAQGFARRFDAPAVAFAFPGVVAMVPGAFAFRVVLGSLQIVSAGAMASPAIVTETLALGATSVLMLAAIAVGVAAPLTLLNPDRRGARSLDPRARGMH